MKVGIVMVSYNAALAVRITLASLRTSKNHTQYKLFLIDNNSLKDQRDEIKKAFDKHIVEDDSLQWSYKKLSKNLGFAGGNNLGIKKFLKDEEITHICLLNSDVIVPDFWLDRLLEKNCDIISAVTNKADSEQCVPIDYSIEPNSCLDKNKESINHDSLKIINDFSHKWHSTWIGNLVESHVTFFCVLLSKNLIEKIGLLDEKFFPGGYEDDDYCLRVISSGNKIYLARDVFIHHFGSASFGQLNHQYFNKRALKNRKYLENKHLVECKRKPEKPIVSYAFDIIYLLNNERFHPLQKYFCKLYVESLSKVIAHYESEFLGIHNHLIHCGQSVPDDLQQAVNGAIQYGNINLIWNELSDMIAAAIEKRSCEHFVREDIQKRFQILENAIYAKSECNLKMHKFLCDVKVFSSGTKPSKKNKLKKVWWMLKKGIPFIWKLKGIVFLGGYPYKEREKDGYFQRIRSIDSLFNERWRIYVDHMKLAGKDVWYDTPEPNVLVLHVENHRYKWFMKWLVCICVIRSRVIYFHSVLRMFDSQFGKFMKWPMIKKIIDIHGVVPEEFRYHNDFFSASMYDAYERLAITKAHYMIVVSNAMHTYFKQKYREAINGKVIILPIFPDIPINQDSKHYINNKPVVVYAGGTHKWQQIAKIVDAINITKEICLHKFFCPKPTEVIQMMPAELKDHPNVIVESKSFNELLEIYDECHYGFILREDIVVNHVSCPTKLIEYLSKGIVPIVDCENMGDFRSLGMKSINVRDFERGKFPDEDERNEIANDNFRIFEELKRINIIGKEELKKAVNNIISGGEYTKNDQLVNPKSKNDLATKIFDEQANNDIYFTKDVADESENFNFKNDDMAFLQSSYDILVQVDNFILGGLENVVLDLNETLINAGFKVGLVVFGEAGPAFEKTKEKKMSACVLEYSPSLYKRILKSTTPKIVISHYSLFGAEICSQFNVPLIQIIHNTYMWFSDKQIKKFSDTIPFTTIFIAVSDFVKHYSVTRLGIPPEKITVIPNGINIKPFKKTDNYQNKRMEVRRGLQISDSDFVFLNVGSITHQKNHMGSVRAFHKILKYCSDVKLVIVGKAYETQLLHELKNYIETYNLSNNILYVGESSAPSMYYMMADAFTHSAFFEGGQLSLLEAISANLSIITTEVGFAMHFKNQKGIKLVSPPQKIINYYGYIWQLSSTADFEREFAIKMLETYKERSTPDIPQEVIMKMDKSHTYKLYIELITDIVNIGEVSGSFKSWPELLTEIKDKAVTTVS